MIAGLVQILFFQGLGELLSWLALPLIPGPVIGLFLMLVFLAVRRGIPEHVETVASVLVQHLGLLFIPAAVGVVMFVPQLKAHGVAVAAALVGSVTLTIAVSAVILKLLARKDADDT